MPLIPELNGDLEQHVSHEIRIPIFLPVTCLVLCEREELLSEPIAVLYGPLLRQEPDNLFSSFDEAISVSPNRVWSIGMFDQLRISGMESVMAHGRDIEPREHQLPQSKHTLCSRRLGQL